MKILILFLFTSCATYVPPEPEPCKDNCVEDLFNITKLKGTEKNIKQEDADDTFAYKPLIE